MRLKKLRKKQLPTDENPVSAKGYTKTYEDGSQLVVLRDEISDRPLIRSHTRWPT